MTKSENLMT